MFDWTENKKRFRNRLRKTIDDQTFVGENLKEDLINLKSQIGNDVMTTKKELKLSITICEMGIPIIEFKDVEDRLCFILKSTYKDTSICIGQSDKGEALFIQQNMLKILLPHLQKFAETGELI